MKDLPLNKVISESDFGQPELRELIQDILPAAGDRRHRKLWEFGMAALALKRGKALRSDALGLSVGAGHEPILYWLTKKIRWLIATDLYADAGEWASGEASVTMLADPDSFAPYPYERRRLTPVHMDALDLRFEDGMFDFAFSMGSIEHFGGFDAAVDALREMARVVRPKGVVAVTTEVVVDGGPAKSIPGTELFHPDRIRDLAVAVPELKLFGGNALHDTDRNGPAVVIEDELKLRDVGFETEPHLQLGDPDGRRFASVSLAFRRRDA